MADNAGRPQRIQLRRTKGWRKPEGAVVVARPSRWGNPFRVGDLYRFPGHWRRPCAEPIEQTSDAAIGEYESRDLLERRYVYRVERVRDRAHAVELFRGYVAVHDDDWYGKDLQHLLGGRDLACWCPLSEPCHADVLLRVAAGEDS